MCDDLARATEAQDGKKKCGSDGSDSVGVRVCRILDAFSAQTMVYGWDHPCWDKDHEEFYIPYQLPPLLDMLLRNAS